MQFTKGMRVEASRGIHGYTPVRKGERGKVVAANDDSFTVQWDDHELNMNSISQSSGARVLDVCSVGEEPDAQG